MVKSGETLEYREEISRLRRRVRDLEYERTRKREKPVPVQTITAIDQLPAFMQRTAKEIVTDASMREIVLDVLERRSEFPSEHVALLAGVGMNERARAHMDKELDLYWVDRGKKWRDNAQVRFQQTVIIGGGLHAAIYAACINRMGLGRPVVIEQSQHPGGVFACSRKPSFYLNSPNRPGDGINVPGRGGPLNYLPGCELQPSHMGGEEYQTNVAMAWVIRMNLALYADVWAGVKVDQVSPGAVFGKSRTPIVDVSRAGSGGKMLVATGLGAPKRFSTIENPRYITFTDLMAMMDKPFPMKGIRRIAVIGAGDSGKCAIEALTGQGPSMLTVPELDYPQIDWWGVRDGCRSREDWRNSSRSRYKGISRLLQNGGSSIRTCRVRVRGSASAPKVGNVIPGLDCVYVDGEPFDLVVDCTGWNTPAVPFYSMSSTPVSSQSDQSGSQWGAVFNRGFFIGAAATPFIAPSALDQSNFRRIGENKSSIFFLARKTEGVAMRLQGPLSF